MRQMEKISLQDTARLLSAQHVSMTNIVGGITWSNSGFSLPVRMPLESLKGLMIYTFSFLFWAPPTVEISECLVNQKTGWSSHAHYYSTRAKGDKKL